jgi:hypothetical protein
MIFAIYFPPMFSKILLLQKRNVFYNSFLFLSNYTQFRLYFLVIYISKPLHRTSHLHFPNIYSIFFWYKHLLYFYVVLTIFFLHSTLHFLSNFTVLCVNENIAHTPYLTKKFVIYLTWILIVKGFHSLVMCDNYITHQQKIDDEILIIKMSGFK